MSRRGSPFTPTEIIFAPTARCNLACGHCRVDRARGTRRAETQNAGARGIAGPPDPGLRIDDAIAFLDDCAAHGIARVGFSGGEPFLEPDFLAALCAKTVELELCFDRLMTNGDWFRDDADLERKLGQVFDAGFDGTIGLSVDDWHGQKPERMAAFISAVGRVAGRYDCIEIISVADRNGSYPLARLDGLASELGAKLLRDGKKPAAIRERARRKNGDGAMYDGTAIDIPVIPVPYSSGALESDAWKSKDWFADDWCVGPGNVLYVHPDGEVSVCCGFANENPELVSGTVNDGFERILAKARSNPHIRDCYERGLTARRLELEATGNAFPGKTGDICFFCDWLCKNGLAAKA